MLVKSDAAALGVHGVALQLVGRDGPAEWVRRFYDDPQSPATRRSIMRLIAPGIRDLHDAGLQPVHAPCPRQTHQRVLATFSRATLAVGEVP